MALISTLATLSSPASGDLLVVEDVSDATNSGKKLALSAAGIPTLATTWTAKQTFSAGAAVSASSGVTLEVGRVSGSPNVKSTETYLLMDSNGDVAALNWFVADDVVLANGGGNVGVGTASPSQALEVYRAAATVRLNVTRGDGATVQLISGASTGVTGTATNHDFQIVTNGVEAARLTAAGLLAVGSTTASGKVHIDQASATGAMPVLLLDQADVSEEFIEFVSTSAANNTNPISTTALGTYAGKLRINVNGTYYWLPFYNS